MKYTLTYTQAAKIGLIDANNVDPHEFAPYCEHDAFGNINGITYPLYQCGACDNVDYDI